MNNMKTIIKVSLIFILDVYPASSFSQDNVHSIYEKILLNVDEKTINNLLSNEYSDGYYPTTIYVNNKKKDTVIFYYKYINGKLTPKININDFILLNIDPSFYNIPLDLNTNFLLSDYSIDFKYNFSSQSLHLAIPQKAFENKKNRLPAQSLWDDGIPALFSSYTYSGQYGKSAQIEQKINFNSGANLGAWRMRSYSNYHYTNKYKRFKLHSLYAYRQLNFLLATFYGGEFTPISRMLSTDKLIGVQLISSNLLSDSNIYTTNPIIEDIAETQAEIKVKQQGRTIYETIVPPGPFILDNLPTIGSDELVLEIKEADGRIKKSTHYFTSMPNQLKKGKYQYNLISGYSYDKIHHKNAQNHKNVFLLGEFSYGINQRITAYGAIRKKSDTDTYFSGLTLDLGLWGGLASDISYFKNKNNQLKYQLRYHKKWVATGTSFSLSSAYYQSTKDNYHKKVQKYKLKNNHSISISQPIKYLGLFSANYYQRNYIEGKNKFTLSTSLSSSIRKVNYSIKYQYKKENNYHDNHFSLNFYIPLMMNSVSNQWLNNQFNYHSNERQYRSNSTIGGSILENSQLSYSINYQHAFGVPNNYHHTSVNTQYRGKYQSYYINGTKSSNNNYHLSTGVNGAIVLHQDGITLAPRLGKTFAIINTEGIAGVKTNNSSQTTTDSSGNLILSNITPYRKNIINLNVQTLPEFSSAKNHSKMVVPTLGAISKVKFPVKTGYNVLFKSNTTLPFSANVTAFDDNNNIDSTAFVSDNNRFFLSGLKEKGWIKVKWGETENHQCQFHYDIKDEIKTNLLIKKEINCQ